MPNVLAFGRVLQDGTERLAFACPNLASVLPRLVFPFARQLFPPGFAAWYFSSACLSFGAALLTWASLSVTMLSCL